MPRRAVAGVFMIVAGMVLACNARAEESAGPIRIQEKMLHLGGYELRVFYDDRDYGVYTTSSTSRDTLGGMTETTIRIWDETISPLRGKVDLDLVMDLGEAFKDMEISRPLTFFLWGGLGLVPGIPLILLSDGDRPPYLGIALSGVGAVTGFVGVVWKVIYLTAERRHDRYYPQVHAQLESALGVR